MIMLRFLIVTRIYTRQNVRGIIVGPRRFGDVSRQRFRFTVQGNSHAQGRSPKSFPFVTSTVHHQCIIGNLIQVTKMKMGEGASICNSSRNSGMLYSDKTCTSHHCQT